MPYIYSLNSTKDFLYDNTDVSIWSTVEPGMGITASSMACLRPLFQAFLSRSRLLGSSTPGNSGWGASRQGDGRINGENGVDGIRLGNSAKASGGKKLPELDITPIDDLEASKDLGLVQGRSASSITLIGHDRWKTNTKRSLTDDSGDEIGRIYVHEEVRVESVRCNV